MRLSYVMLTAVAILAGRDMISTVDSNQVVVDNTLDGPFVARVLNVDGENAKRFLRIYEDDNSVLSEERAIPGLNEIAEKIKPTADKVKAQAVTKLTPYAAKLTDKTMAVAVRLKPVVDTFSGKLKPIADKLIPILKPIVAKVNTVPIVQRIMEKLKNFVEKVKNYQIGDGQRYTMAKFESWFKQNKSPDDVKAILKVGVGPTVNTKDYDLWIQYTAFYRFAQREREVKAAAAAA